MDPRFDPETLRDRIVASVRERYGALLGPYVALLEDEEGLEELLFRIRCGELGPLP